MSLLEKIEVISKAVAILGALVAAGFALWQARQNLSHRKNDLRWRQAEMAKKIVDEWFDHEPSRDALRMIEPRKRSYRVSDTETRVIPHPDVSRALSSTSAGNDPVEIYIQDCFDSLFYYLDRAEQFLDAGLILFEDVGHPAQYYVEHMAAEKNTYRTYAESIGYTGALEFLDRFPAWKS